MIKNLIFGRFRTSYDNFFFDLRSENFVVKHSEAVGWYANASLLFTQFICKPHWRGSRRFHGRMKPLLPFANSIYELHNNIHGSRCFHGGRNARLPFAKSISKLHRRGSQCFHGGRDAHLPFAKTIYKLRRRGSRCFHECRNAPLLFV